MGYLTTHILDTTKGIAAAGVKIHLYQHNDGQRQLINSTISNNDGRCDQPLLQDDDFSVGVYELEFAIDEYFAVCSLAITAASIPALSISAGNCILKRILPLNETGYSFSDSTKYFSSNLGKGAVEIDSEFPNVLHNSSVI